MDESILAAVAALPGRPPTAIRAEQMRARILMKCKHDHDDNGLWRWNGKSKGHKDGFPVLKALVGLGPTKFDIIFLDAGNDWNEIIEVWPHA